MAVNNPPGQPARRALGLLALVGGMPLLGWGLAIAQTPPPEPPALPPPPALTQPQTLTQPGAEAIPQPLEPDPAALRTQPAARFDASLDSLVRDGVVTDAERSRIREGVVTVPVNVPAHRQACNSGALSAQECRTGIAFRWRSRIAADGQLVGERLGLDGRPLPPLTVPVSALLAADGGTFRLADVFAVTPRPAPIGGNGNRRLLFPLIGPAMTSSAFGYRLHPLLGSWLMHSGRDLAAPEGTPVVAALAGQVLSSGLASGYGLAIEIEHERPQRRTLYGHLSELYVKAGDRVQQGEVIGRVGSTGLSTGPHLHFELRLPGDGGWVAVDPGDLDPGRAGQGSDAVALLLEQLLRMLERPGAAARA